MPVLPKPIPVAEHDGDDMARLFGSWTLLLWFTTPQRPRLHRLSGSPLWQGPPATGTRTWDSHIWPCAPVSFCPLRYEGPEHRGPGPQYTANATGKARMQGGGGRARRLCLWCGTWLPLTCLLLRRMQAILLAMVPIGLMSLKWAASTGPAFFVIPCALLALPIAGGGKMATVQAPRC